MFVARAYGGSLSVMGGNRSGSISVSAQSTGVIADWSQDPSRPVEIQNGSDFIMPAEGVVNIAIGSTYAIQAIAIGIQKNGVTIASSSSTSSPSLSANAVQVSEGDRIRVTVTNSGGFTGSRSLSGGEITFTPVS